MEAPLIIRRKRDGLALSRDDIFSFVERYMRGEIPDYQFSALLMAIYFRGLDARETADLTEAMMRSGQVLDLSQFPQAKVDKHSTGGVGDKTSLIVGPVAAAGGLMVPMISGRGLGHTGGTLDKLESIPGFNTRLTLDEFRRVLGACGMGLIGQTDDLAPADRRLYALRDVTATVESIPLICASILSKKMAEGIDGLVLDVKTGSGAFMKNIEDAANLAELLVETGKRMGKKVVALLTDMSQPLGHTAGNAMEVVESIEVLGGAGPADLRELCLELAAWMFLMGERVKTIDDGKKLSSDLIVSGQAREKFREIVGLQGGDVGVVDDPRRLKRARQTLEVTSPSQGFIATTRCEQLGIACVVLGGGREKKDDTIDPAVGLEFHKRVGDAVERDEPLCTLHYNSETRLEEARRLVETAYQIEPEKPKTIPEKQAAAAVGQGILMHTYENFFSEYRQIVAQVLLTREDSVKRTRYTNSRNTLLTLLKMGVIPIINENDAVAIDELKIGDNDTLSAMVASIVDADVLIILSDIEGVYTDNPQSNPEAKLISEIVDITPAIEALAGGAGSLRGTGGMYTKIQAGKIAVNSGVAMIIASGLRDDVIGDVLKGSQVGTIFL